MFVIGTVRTVCFVIFSLKQCANRKMLLLRSPFDRYGRNSFVWGRDASSSQLSRYDPQGSNFASVGGQACSAVP